MPHAPCFFATSQGLFTGGIAPSAPPSYPPLNSAVQAAISNLHNTKQQMTCICNPLGSANSVHSVNFTPPPGFCQVGYYCAVKSSPTTAPAVQSPGVTRTSPTEKHTSATAELMAAADVQHIAARKVVRPVPKAKLPCKFQSSPNSQPQDN